MKTLLAPQSKPKTEKSVVRIFDQSNAICEIFTFKEGLLSPLAHDLKLQATRFEIKVEGSPKESAQWDGVVARFHAASIRAVSAMKNGVKSPDTLSKNDLRDIERNIAKSVLSPEKFPFVLFQSRSISGDPENFKITGVLKLCNITRRVTIPVKRKKGRYLAELTINQNDFGMTPFSAFFGAIKVRPEIIIRVTF